MRPSGVAWCSGRRGSASCPCCCPRALQIRPDSARSAPGCLPRPLPKGLRVAPSPPFANALTATVQDLKTACPLSSCGQLKELPPALTQGKKKGKKKKLMKAQGVPRAVLFPARCFI